MRTLGAFLLISWLGLYLPVGYAPIVNGVHDTTALGQGIARLEGMTWGNAPSGRTVIIGHNPGAFEHLHELRKGDQVLLYYEDGTVEEYEVFGIFWTVPEDVALLSAVTYRRELMLITCSADESHRLVVRARLVK